MAYRASTIAISMAGERETWRMAKEHWRLGFRLARAAAWSRVGTCIRAVRDMLDLRGFYQMGHKLDRASARCYDRCTRICGVIVAAGPR